MAEPRLHTDESDRLFQLEEEVRRLRLRTYGEAGTPPGIYAKLDNDLYGVTTSFNVEWDSTHYDDTGVFDPTLRERVYVPRTGRAQPTLFAHGRTISPTSPGFAQHIQAQMDLIDGVSHNSKRVWIREWYAPADEEFGFSLVGNVMPVDEGDWFRIYFQFGTAPGAAVQFYGNAIEGYHTALSVQMVG